MVEMLLRTGAHSCLYVTANGLSEGDRRAKHRNRANQEEGEDK